MFNLNGSTFRGADPNQLPSHYLLTYMDLSQLLSDLISQKVKIQGLVFNQYIITISQKLTIFRTMLLNAATFAAILY